jgi:hypothetical protein
MLSFSSFALFAKAQTALHYKIAVFAPLFIDSAFDGNNYKAGNTIPKTILPGLEFYNGVMLAIDSLQAEKQSLEVNIYDTKSSKQNIYSIINKQELNNVSLIIASFTNKAETKMLADYALSKKIPILSATYPNDAGITNNPYFILINSTLLTHCDELYKHLQHFYSTGNIVFVRRKGSLEDVIQSVFIELNKNTPAIPLKMKNIELTDTFTNKQLLDNLDSNRQNIVVCASIDEAFGLRLVRTLAQSKNYSAIAIGMPTWDGLKELDNADFKGIEIVYSTPYNFNRADKSALQFNQSYRSKYNGRGSDMAFKGFESMYHFSKLLIQNGNNFINHLSDKSFKLFNDFDIRTVKNKTTGSTDYLENRKLYFLKKSDGVIRSVN